jgi:uncharacterized circularly permuted ATP-grasp superfamily protein
MRFNGYDTEGYYDEMFCKDGAPRDRAQILVDLIESLGEGDLAYRQHTAEGAMLKAGITFTVYNDDAGTERIIPFDILPRVIDSDEWDMIEAGLMQRIEALNQFLQDIYGQQHILKDKVIPEQLIKQCTGYRAQCIGLEPPRGVWCHITGTDLVRNADGQIHVLEDNLRCPSGVSYVLQDRQIMKQTFPQVFAGAQIRPVADYPARLLDTLSCLAPDNILMPKVALLTPGPYNSAYFEHSFLAQQMGIELVEGRDLVVSDGHVYMRTTQGFEHIDVLYRRIDDDFLDPQWFREDSMLGVPGLMEAFKAGNIALANAPGTGVADDKVIYTFVPQMIRYYLDQDAILPNVDTYLCSENAQRDHVLQNLDKLVVKPAAESGGYGMLIGPHATAEERSEFADRIKARPDNYIAQPTLSLSRMPVLCDDHFEGRHIDLRPFILYGRGIYVLPGGLTRVALRKGSLVVNSSQGGGSKDTWVLSKPTRRNN